MATCHLKACHKLLKQLATSLWMTSFDHQLASSLLTTYNGRNFSKLSKAMQAHPDIGLFITSPLQDLSTDLSQIVSFWMCKGTTGYARKKEREEGGESKETIER